MSEIIQGLVKLQEEDGWLDPARLTALAEELRVPLHRLESVSTFYTHFRRQPPEGTSVDVCRDLSCQLAGGEAACARLRAWAADNGSGDGGGNAGDDAASVEVDAVSCLGRCDAAPAASVGDRVLSADDLEAIESATRAGVREPLERPVRAWPAADPYATAGSAPRDASDRSAPSARSDYRILRGVLEAGSREAPIRELEAAGLRGMGGAGFPTARKWSLVASEAASPKHVVCNADESEPGTFKDREILHDLPHLVVEGLLLAGYCVGAERGTVFIRHEYEPERRRLVAAIEEARAAGALGEQIFGSDFSFEIDVFVSPGGYILGEETALLECMEGRRGEPRNKPPFPGNAGLHGMPTLINNVETLMHAAGIVHHGSDWWHALGRDGFSGHKFISVSGDVAEPGVSLFSVGTPLREVLGEHGGMARGASLMAVAPGGASSNFMGPEALDVALDFDAIAAAGSMLGSGAAVFISEEHDLLEVALSVTRFFRNESCGKCVPCRVGSEKAVALIEKAGGVGEAESALLQALNETMGQTSICGLGQVALGPLLSMLARFPTQIRRPKAQ
ncbi:MAG: NAD(P)H-dependent oxidoreductase subunit E [Myxococcota bacterium]